MIFTLAYDMSYLQICSWCNIVLCKTLWNHLCLKIWEMHLDLWSLRGCSPVPTPPLPPCHGTGSKITLNTGPNIPAMVTTGTSIYTTVLVYTHTWNQTYFSPCLKHIVGKRHIRHTGDGQYVWFVVEEASHTVGQVDIMVADAWSLMYRTVIWE